MKKIVIIKGGLGNQFFQYSFSKFLELNFPTDEILLDFSHYNNHDGKNDIFKPRILDYNVKIKQLNYKNRLQRYIFKKFVKYKFLFPFIGFFTSKILSQRKIDIIPIKKLKKANIFDGYWQNITYIENIRSLIIKDFKLNIKISPKAVAYINEVKNNKNSVFIGFRLGDYTKKKLIKKYGNLNTNYFESAILSMNKKLNNTTYYIFSNDIKKVKTLKLFESIKHIFIDDLNNPQEELEIMRSCSNAIIMNSTFHWWGAFLIENKNKVIISPQNWFVNGWKDNIIPENWIKI